MDTRREFLKKSALLAGASALTSAIPASILKALAINPAPGSDFTDAQHVVILMQENRSFDHCFGSLRGVRGFDDPRRITLPDQNPVWLQTNQAGETFAPFRFNMKESKITWMGDIPHSRSSQVDANNNGRYDQWLDSKKSPNKQYEHIPLTMGYYVREDLPFNYALADAFTVCDQNFSSAMTSTFPNRLYLWSGTIREEKNEEAKAYVRNDIPFGEARWVTFPERLEQHGISWKVYQNDLAAGGGFKGQERAWLANFGCNSLEFLSQFNVRFSGRYVQSLKDSVAKLHDEIASLDQRIIAARQTDADFSNLDSEMSKKKEVLQDKTDQLVKWSKKEFEKLTPYQQALYHRAFTTNAGDPDYHHLENLQYEENGIKRELLAPKGDVLYQFRKDVDEGTLPTVSWLVPSQNLSDHPSAPWFGSWFISEILDILTKNPEVWKKTIFILTYDENDGYFDHVPPFMPPDPLDPLTGKCSPAITDTGVEYIRRERELAQGISPKEARAGAIGLGYRVPMIVASPWSRGGKVCSQLFDHTSPLQFLEVFLNKKFGKNIREENISQWRRAICGNLTSAFSNYNGKEPDAIPYLTRNPFLESIYNAKFKEIPGSFRSLSAEEIAQIKRDPSMLPARQEPGTRPSNPLPYELYAEGYLKKSVLEVTMQAGNTAFGSQSAGAPFMVYAPGRYVTSESENQKEKIFEPVRTWQFAVIPGGQLSAQWPLEHFEGGDYHLRVYGPNGFYRELTGNHEDPEVQITCTYEHSILNPKKLSGNIVLTINNINPSRSHDLVIKDLGYQRDSIRRKIAPSAQILITLGLQESSGWYDFVVQVQDEKSFSRHFAGRVETGNESTSDPQIGRYPNSSV